MSQLGVIVKQIKDAGLTIVHIRDIDFSTAEDSELKELASLIRGMKGLSSVVFRNVNLGGVSVENLRLIFEAIQSRVENLLISLVDNNLGMSQDKLLLIIGWLVHTNVSKLGLSANNLGFLTDDTLEKLLSIGPVVTLREIDLSDNNFGDLANNGLLTLGKYLVLCKNVNFLQLHHNFLGTNQCICEFLEQLHGLSLEELGLVGNKLCDALDPDNSSGEKTVKALSSHPSLLRLNLADNLLVACGADRLLLFLRCVSQNSILKKIDLTVNQFEVLRSEPQWDSFLKNFATFIAGASQSGLEVIYNYCNFDDESNKALKEMIANHKALISSTSFFHGDSDTNICMQIEIGPIHAESSKEAETNSIAPQQLPSTLFP